jgi:chymotrypsin
MAHSIIRNTIVDISLIKLKTSVHNTYSVKPAFLPRASEREELFVNREAEVCGLGIEEEGIISSNLKFTKLKILSQNDCRPFYGIVDPKIMCAKSTDSNASTCKGDSGSPLIVKDGDLTVVVGVVSFGTAFGCDIGK